MPDRTRVFICGPMNGLPGRNHAMFNDLAQRLRDRGYAVLNPVDVDKQVSDEEDRDWAWYVRRSLQMMLEAQGIALLPGWEIADTAKLEVEIASYLKMDVRPAQAWLQDEEAMAEPPC